jgi:hypothetical protein
VRRIPIEIVKGLKFIDALNSKERQINMTLDVAPGAIYNTRADTHEFFVGNQHIKRMINWNGSTYSMRADGVLVRNGDFLESGYGDVSFMVAQPTATTQGEYLFIAGSTKMIKYNSSGQVFNWGITAPTVALTPSLAGGSATIQGRYTYQYYSDTTGQRSNFAPLSANFDSTGQEVLLQGFVASTDPQVTHQVILRDLDGGGTFFEVAFKANDTADFTDDLNDASLVTNPEATNDHGTPLNANLAIMWGGSAWLNDVNSRYRLQVSVPGRPGSFEAVGFNDLGDLTEVIRAFGVIGGELFIWTHKRIYRVSGEYPFFFFNPISDLGLISSYSISFTVDTAAFGSNSGVWLFNGASAQQLPDIWALFDPNSPDPRRYGGFDPNNFIVGTDNRNVWVTWHAQDLQIRTYQYSLTTKTWSQRQIPLSVINWGTDSFFTQAGDFNGNVIRLNGGLRGFFEFVTSQIDIEFAEIINAEINYLGGPVHWWASVDEVEIYLGILPFQAVAKPVNVALPQNVYGRTIFFKFLNAGGQDFGVDKLFAFVNEFPIANTVWDSGEIPLGHYKQTPQDLILHFAIMFQSDLAVTVYIDGKVTEFFGIPQAGPGYVGPLRFSLKPIDGRSVRVKIISVARFVIFNALLGITPLGDQTIKSVELGGEYINLTRKAQRALRST